MRLWTILRWSLQESEFLFLSLFSVGVGHSVLVSAQPGKQCLRLPPIARFKIMRPRPKAAGSLHDDSVYHG